MKKAPRLRFKQFNSDWSQSIIGDIAEVTSSKRVHVSDYVSSGVPFYRGKEISELERGEVPKDVLYISEEQFNEFKTKFGSPRKGDLLITAVGTIGNIYRVKDDEDFYFKDGNIIWLKNPKVNSKFLKICLEKNIDSIRDSSSGSSQKALTIIELKKINFFSPNEDEQQKVSKFFSAVDQKISLLTTKHELLVQYKKGVMQKIFNQEIRFKDKGGKDFPEWVKVKLENVAEFFRGGQLAKSHLDANGESMCIHYGELFTVYSETISEIKSRTNLKNGFIGKFGDILMPSSDVTPDGLARASCLMLDNVVLGGDMNIIRPTNVNSSMLSYLLNFNKNAIIGLVSGTTVKHIYIKDLKGIELLIPGAAEEQAAISKFLIEIDKKIKLITSQMAITKQYKQGLLQQMFI